MLSTEPSVRRPLSVILQQVSARHLVTCFRAGRSGINKPVAVLDWLEKAQPPEEYILILDADMIMRRPFDPVRLGVRPGERSLGVGMSGTLQ